MQTVPLRKEPFTVRKLLEGPLTETKRWIYYSELLTVEQVKERASKWIAHMNKVALGHY